MAKKKIYISIPITGKPIELARIKIDEVKSKIQKTDIPVSPLDLKGEEDDYATCMGKDITGLLQCDSVYFVRGWHTSKGCNAEYEIAKIYGKELIFE